jgi:hypothetical protein
MSPGVEFIAVKPVTNVKILERLRTRIEARQAIVGAEPHVAVSIIRDRPDPAIADTGRIRRTVQIPREDLRSGVIMKPDRSWTIISTVDRDRPFSTGKCLNLIFCCENPVLVVSNKREKHRTTDASRFWAKSSFQDITDAAGRARCIWFDEKATE